MLVQNVEKMQHFPPIPEPNELPANLLFRQTTTVSKSTAIHSLIKMTEMLLSFFVIANLNNMPNFNYMPISL